MDCRVASAPGHDECVNHEQMGSDLGLFAEIEDGHASLAMKDGIAFFIRPIESYNNNHMLY
jgi:hypothetical protein